MFAHLFIVFFVTIFFEYIFWKSGGVGIWLDDQNKGVPRKVISGGGIIVVSVVFIYYIYMNTLISIALALSLIIALSIGVYDDFRFIRKWKKVPILLLASVPIVAFYLLYGNLWEPKIIWWNFGILYWIAIVPVVIAGFANGGNVIGGYDGMEVGIYTLISLLYVFIGISKGDAFVVQLSLIPLTALLAMLAFNWAPSKIILGNSGSFAISALLGIIPLIGHFAIVLPIIYAPHLVEVFLQIKYTRKHKYTVFGDVGGDGVIHNKYGKIMSILHWIISWGNMNEKKITLAMLGIEGLLCGIAFSVWYLLFL